MAFLEDSLPYLLLRNNSNGARTLQTELSNREGYETLLVGGQAIPLDQKLKHRQGEGQTRLKILPDTMQDLFEVTDHRQHRQDGLDEHAVVPLPALTQFEVDGITCHRMEGGVTQDNHALGELPNQGLKRVVRHIGRGTIPRDHQAPLVQEQTSFATHNPAV